MYTVSTNKILFAIREYGTMDSIIIIIIIIIINKRIMKNG